MGLPLVTAPRANTSQLVFSDDGTKVGKVSVEPFDGETVHSRTSSRRAYVNAVLGSDI
jgi:hypothetical protein